MKHIRDNKNWFIESDKGNRYYRDGKHPEGGTKYTNDQGVSGRIKDGKLYLDGATDPVGSNPEEYITAMRTAKGFAQDAYSRSKQAVQGAKTRFDRVRAIREGRKAKHGNASIPKVGSQGAQPAAGAQPNTGTGSGTGTPNTGGTQPAAGGSWWGRARGAVSNAASRVRSGGQSAVQTTREVLWPAGMSRGQIAMRVGGYGAGALGVGGGLTYLAAGGGRRPEEAAAATTGSTNYVTPDAGKGS